MGNYRLGYGESTDGLKWEIMDDRVSIIVSKDGWGSEMIEYAAVVKYNEHYYMFYNGINYGENGVGLAIGMMEK